MSYIGMSSVMYWFVLPIILFASIIFRFNLLSSIYLLFLIALPYSPGLSPQKLRTWIAYILTLTIISGVFLLTQVGFQIAVLVDDSFLGTNCSFSESVSRYVGFIGFKGIDAGNIVRLLLPDIVVFVVSFITYFLLGKVHRVYLSWTPRERTNASQIKQSSIKVSNEAIFCFTMLLLAMAGIAYPSVVSSIYLLVFLFLSICWAFLLKLVRKSTAVLRAILSVVTTFHLIALYLYQLQFSQELIPPLELYARLFGLTAIIETNCQYPYALILRPNILWTQLVSPGCIFLLHWMLAIGVRMYYQYVQVTLQDANQGIKTLSRRHSSILKSTEKRPLVLEEELPQSYDALRTVSPADVAITDAVVQQDDIVAIDKSKIENDASFPVDSSQDINAGTDPPCSLQNDYSQPSTSHIVDDSSPLPLQLPTAQEGDLFQAKLDATMNDKPEDGVQSTPKDLSFLNLVDTDKPAVTADATENDMYIEQNQSLSSSKMKLPSPNRSESSNMSAPQPSGAPQTSYQSFKYELLLEISLWFSDIGRYSFYVVALIVMMLWSVTYHSWLTFILLLGACILWMTKNTGLNTLYCSPFLSIYGMLLVLLQFVYSLNLLESELPTSITQRNGNTLNLTAFGINRYAYPCLHLGAQILYLCGFLVVLHQFNYRRTSNPTGRDSLLKNTITESIAEGIIKFLCKYWIFVVVGFHLAVSTEGYPTGIKVIYMLLFLLNIITYCFSWGIWRRLLTFYWTILVFYTMIVLILIYTYQFPNFPSYWMSFTNFTTTQLQDLGLQQAPTAGDLIAQIILPTFFLLVIILQLQYFNKRFLELTKTPQVSSAPVAATLQGQNDDSQSIEMNQINRVEPKTKKKLWKRLWFDWLPKINTAWCELLSFIERALEFHVWRLVFITVFIAAVYQISALFGLFVLFWVLLLPFRKTHFVLFRVTSLIASLVIIAIMFYQLQFITQDVHLKYNCTFDFYGENVTHMFVLTDWIGVIKMDDNGTFFYHAQGYIAIVLIIAFDQTVNLRRTWRRVWKNEPEPLVTAFYPSITHRHLDEGIVECMKFFINYFFYKFGVEVCYVMTAITVLARTDVYSVVYCLLMIVALSIKNRANLYRFWDFYVAILMMLVLWQYAATLGMPSFWCQYDNYPWFILGTNEKIRNRLITWLHLPDYLTKPYPYPSVADYFQLLFVVSQVFVFEKDEIIAMFVGNNDYLTGRDMDAIQIDTNPKKNFLYKESRTILDQAKQFVFKYMIWITMGIIFFAGTSRISVFTLGYLIIFFYLLSRQQALIMGKPSHLLKVFSGLLGYCVFVITLKAALQLAACVYIEKLRTDACVFVQFMGLTCAKPQLYKVKSSENSETCELSYTDAGFVWDFVCFFFLLIQRRIFASYYFLHVAEDMRISMSLANRGAELFNDRLIEEVKEREKIQEQNLLSIKESMQIIKQSYLSLSKSLSSQPTHLDATRSGDYYMFHDDSLRRRHTDFVSSDKGDDIMDPVTMLYKADSVGLKRVLEERKEDRKRLGDPYDTTSIESNVSFGLEEDPMITFSPTPDIIDDGVLTQSDSDEAFARSKKLRKSAKFKENKEPPAAAAAATAASDENLTFWEKVKRGFQFLWELFLSGVDSFTIFLNKSNRNYRIIALRLAAEKDLLSTAMLQSQTEPTINIEEVTIEVEQGISKTDDHTSHSDKKFIDFHDSKAIEFDKDQHRALRLFYAIWYVIISRTDMVCYFLIILNLMLYASILAIVLPLAVFLWATFIIPRPAKFFWTFAIIYLEVVIVIKFIFQFEFFPWNSLAVTNLNELDPFWWPRLIGIEQSPNWSVMDLLQLIAIFFHASILKVHGLWDSIDVQERRASQIPSEPGTSQSALLKEGSNQVENPEEQSNKKWTIGSIPYRIYRLYNTLLNQRFTSVTDVYIYQFLCDVINFIIIIFGYNAFGKFSSGTVNVVSDIQSNNVPTGFLIMLLIQFLIMFIDRAIYLMKNLYAKFAFHVVLVIAIHIWMFAVLPSLNGRPFFLNHVAQTYYFFKALYFFLAAYQIRAGYPKRVAGNFLTKSYGTINLFLFKAYRAIPFLAEITAIMDWMYTGTSMSISEWMKLWAIHAEIFEIKCWRVFEAAYPTPRGIAKAKWIKYLIGGLLLFLLLGIIWFPLLFMNIVLTIGGISNNPLQVDLTITLGNFEPIFQVISDENDIVKWTPQQYADFSHDQSVNEEAAEFLLGFSSNEVVSVKLQGESKTVWIISPPQREQLLETLDGDRNVTVLLDWTLTNDPAKTSVVMSTGSNRIILVKNDTTRDQLYSLLSGNSSSNTTVFLKNLLPQYIHSSGQSSKAAPASRLYPNKSENFLDVGVSLQSENNLSWWRVQDYDSSTSGGHPEIKIIVFSDKVSPSSLSFLVSYGIIGLYVSVVLVVGRLVRSIFIGTTASIMFVELPFVDRILGLCNDIFMVREEAEYVLEEDLYAKLIFLYRSPSTLIQWSRKPKEN